MFIHTVAINLAHRRSRSQWTPEGRRLLAGASTGEITLWHGLTFNFDTILPVRLCSPFAPTYLPA